MLKRNLFFLCTVTIFAIASLVLDIFNYNPFEAQTAVFVNFYVSLFLTLGGVLAFTIYYCKIYFSKETLLYKIFWPSVRQALFLSLALTTLLIMKGLKLLDIWVGFSLVVIILLLELFFQTKRTVKKTTAKSRPNRDVSTSKAKA